MTSNFDPKVDDGSKLPLEEDMNPGIIIPVVDTPEAMARNSAVNDKIIGDYIQNHADIDLIDGMNIIDYGDRVDGVLFLTINDRVVEMQENDVPVSGSDMADIKGFIDSMFDKAKVELLASESQR